jgi:hypothetical protein
MYRYYIVFLLFGLFGFLVFGTYTNAGQLVYSTFLGGSNDDIGYAIAVDSSGDAYITGETYSSDFPITSGAFDTTFYGSDFDGFVAKVNAAGTALLYSTYFGGNSYDHGHGIAVDNSGNAYITGYTWSSDFPTTPGAFDTNYNGNFDAFVAKINPTGSALLYSTFLGGNNIDEGHGIAVDNSGNAYITGRTNSSAFPTTPGAYDTTPNGGLDVFVTKVNATGSALLYSTYIGGNGSDVGYAITIDSSRNAYITGYTWSANFPATSGAFDTSLSLLYDTFATKLNSSGSALVYSTYLGGSGGETGFGIAVDNIGNASITGSTGSSDFPTTAGAYHTIYISGGDGFVTKVNAAGSALIYSTYFGGFDNDVGYSVAIDTAGNDYITGATFSSDFPTTPTAVQPNFSGGSYDGFMIKLNTSGSELLYSTYLGGNNYDYGNGIALDKSGDVYIVGLTQSPDFPTTAGALDTSYNGSYDVFISKVSLATSPYLNSYGEFTISSDTQHWYFEKYGDGISAGTLSWATGYSGQTGVARIRQTPGQKGKLTQVFSVPSTGWYTAIAKVATDIAAVTKQQKVYLYLQELDSSTAVAATANEVIQSGSGGFNGAGVWKQMQISFYAQNTLLGIQVVGINPTNSSVTGNIYFDDIWVYAGAPQVTAPIVLNNPSFSAGTVGWMYAVYADGTGTGTWTGINTWSGHTSVLKGSQAGGEKAKVSQLYSAPTSIALGSVWVYSASSSMSNSQKVYLYIYSNDSGYNKIIESGNAILQPGKWVPNQWQQLRFGYIPLTPYNAVQLVGINPIGKPYQSLYFDEVAVKQ